MAKTPSLKASARLVFSVSPLYVASCFRRLSTAHATGDAVLGHRPNG
jgi:hypothetical protein